MERPKTFFEQIPVETVKRIAEEFPEQSTIPSDAGKSKPNEAKSPRGSWREVAQKVQNEENPTRMVELVEQLIATLDQEQLRKCPTRKPDAGGGFTLREV